MVAGAASPPSSSLPQAAATIVSVSTTANTLVNRFMSGFPSLVGTRTPHGVRDLSVGGDLVAERPTLPVVAHLDPYPIEAKGFE